MTECVKRTPWASRAGLGAIFFAENYRDNAWADRDVNGSRSGEEEERHGDGSGKAAQVGKEHAGKRVAGVPEPGGAGVEG